MLQLELISVSLLTCSLLTIGLVSKPTGAAPPGAPKWIKTEPSSSAGQAESSRSAELRLIGTTTSTTTESDPYADAAGAIVEQLESQSDFCPLCLEPIGEYWLEAADCGQHCYHQRCYNKWLTEARGVGIDLSEQVSKKCPTCTGLRRLHLPAFLNLREVEDLAKMGLSNNYCPLCEEKLTSKGAVVSARCWHVFHTECIHDWESKSRLIDSRTRETKCPVCGEILD